MPSCDQCGEFVKRRKSIAVSELTDQDLDEEVMVCRECYDIACKKDPTKPVCQAVDKFLKESNREKESRKFETLKSRFSEMELESKEEDDFNKYDSCKKCQIYSSRRNRLDVKRTDEELDDEILSCGECYSLKCKGKKIEKKSPCKETLKTKTLAEYARERMLEKISEQKRKIQQTLMKEYPEKYFLKSEEYPKPPRKSPSK
jgi:hypothetical protein